MLRALREQNRIVGNKENRTIRARGRGRHMSLDEAVETIKKHPLLNREILSELQEAKIALESIAQHWAGEVVNNSDIDETDLEMSKKKLHKACSALEGF